MIKKIYKKALIFGTFDQLHKGHQIYIDKAFNLAENVEILVMSDEATRPTKIYTPYSLEKRQKQISKYLSNKKISKDRYEIGTWYERPELYGRMIKKPFIDLVITGEEYIDRTLDMFYLLKEKNNSTFSILLHPRYRENKTELTSTGIRLRKN